MGTLAALERIRVAARSFPTHVWAWGIEESTVTRTTVAILALLLPGCGHISPLRSDLVDAEFVVPRDGARSASVELEVPGDLHVHAGSCSLVKARARYDAARAEARADFQIDESGDGTVQLSIEKTRPPSTETELDVCVSTELPLKLTATVGVGDATFDLSGVQLRDFDATSGTGDTNIDFGDASVADAQMSIDTGTGDLTVDAKRATWTGENTLKIDAGTGDVTVYLPRGIGVRVAIDRGTGSLAIRGLEKDGDHYVNGLSSSSDDRLDVEIDTGLGDVTIIAG